MTTAEPRTLTLKDLRTYQDTLFVRNNTPKTITCNDKKFSFTLGPRGADDSVQVLPPEVAVVPGFQRAYLRGDMTISSDPDMENELRIQAERKGLIEQERTSATQAIVEPSTASRSMVPMKCLISDELVFQSEQEVKDMVPPLAERFKDQASQWIPVESIDPETRSRQVTWSRPTIQKSVKVEIETV